MKHTRPSLGFDRREFLGLLAALGIAGCTGKVKAPFPVLEASGSPGDLGLAQGRAFSQRIRANLDFYLSWLSEAGQVSAPRLFELAGRFAPVLGEHFPDLLEELEGVARGAKIPLESVLLINARTDLKAVVTAQLTADKVPACTALALHGRRREREVLALAQNWDWNPILADAPVILRLQPSNGPSLVTLVEAGMIGKIGFNQHRLGVCLNFLSHTADGDGERLGVPIHCLLRAVLDSAGIDEAVDRVRRVPRCASANFLLAQHGYDGRRSVDVEISPPRVAAIENPGMDMVHTNHFLSPELAGQCTSGRGPSTMKRYAAAARLVTRYREALPDPAERAQRVLESREDLPYPISRDHNPGPSSSTLAGIVMDLSDNRLILTRGAPHKATWVDLPGV